uniref:Homeobox domain-containing protein n=1 Tax=Paramoeba aestuarina TaxID=180227 RepID=A0A7S4NV03_9EUKA|mmetsp:Transcript_29363/g.45376  ORF Transcript_29363/g.45376 Transcript_29363/m.45376 type:complete len:240 (+) Transcript_29363:146-865(+)|eukprot:CAMPEP_0201508672 /NCGR_PEP_ID=MMETSP0161_2-20130828/1958_1 /ASSEMBLY_ACC=CAM_ASM_000251 /TAXON_ID=180227 /ORGANISM="Neoparamoeba aestuarina, Strain SoJaBio B1-5/56/2" /LENGTH=239 /DNA_ID=CAMNT_0047903409 /DNA_START=128 /DNA_END=847 /DNA_ORIENTATION=-
MPILDHQDPVTYQLLNVPSADEQDDQELMENGVFWLLALRRNATCSKGDFHKTLQTSKALKGIQTDSVRPKVDLGVQAQDLNKKRKRATREEVAILRRAFSVNPLPPLEVRSKIAHQLNWTPRKVKIWFQNERAKLRKRSRDCDSTKDCSQDENSQDEGGKSPIVHYPSASSSTSIPPPATEQSLLAEASPLAPQLSQSVLSSVNSLHPFPFHIIKEQNAVSAMMPNFRQWATAVGGDQ